MLKGCRAGQSVRAVLRSSEWRARQVRADGHSLALGGVSRVELDELLRVLRGDSRTAGHHSSGGSSSSRAGQQRGASAAPQSSRAERQQIGNRPARPQSSGRAAAERPQSSRAAADHAALCERREHLVYWQRGAPRGGEPRRPATPWGPGRRAAASGRQAEASPAGSSARSGSWGSRPSGCTWRRHVASPSSARSPGVRRVAPSRAAAWAAPRKPGIGRVQCHFCESAGMRTWLRGAPLDCGASCATPRTLRCCSSSPARLCWLSFERPLAHVATSVRTHPQPT